MKTIRFIAVMMFFAAFSSISAFAQPGTTAAPATQNNMRVAVINTQAFGDEKAGIAKFVNAYKQIQTEFKQRFDELSGIEARLKKIAADIQTLTGQTVVDRNSIASKQEEGETLQRDYTRKAEDLKAAVQKREASVVGPIYQDIGKAIKDFAKARGYAVVLDISKDENGMIVWADMDSIDATTADFIKFYNARPGTSASTAAPK